MSVYKQKLEDNLADAELALVMANYAEVLGKVSISQYEKAFPPDKEVPLQPNEAERQFQMLMKRHKIKTEPTAKRSRFWRKALLRVAAVAAAIAIVFAALLLVQASGIDIFGAIGEWTNSTFHFRIGNQTEEMRESEENNTVKELHTILIDHGISPEYAPKWLPEGYSIIDVASPEYEGAAYVVVALSSEQNYWILYEVRSELDSNQGTIWIEKDNNDAEIYDIPGKRFYLFTNDGNAVATWCDKNVFIQLTDSSGVDELKLMLDSMGGN